MVEINFSPALAFRVYLAHSAKSVPAFGDWDP